MRQVFNGDCTNGSRRGAADCYLGKESLETQASYFDRENLCTIVEPHCGGCKCGKCPIPGSRFSHSEEGELRKIRDNLVHNGKCWQTAYPFLFPRELLKASYKSGMKVLESTEKSLKRNGGGKQYNACIEEMLQHKVVKKVLKEEMDEFICSGGVVNYLPHLPAFNPKSKSTPIHVVFDASRQQEGGPSLNQLLVKGPDRYLNNLAEVITKFRVGRNVAQGDIKKMFNAVELEYKDTFLQCFLWRKMDDSKEPEMYRVVVNNMGIKPACSIAKEAMDKSAELFEDVYPNTAEQLKTGSYVDDLGVVDESDEALKERTQEADEILKHVGMKVPKWLYSGEEADSVELGNITNKLMADEAELDKVLGLSWDSRKDVFRFSVKINLNPLRKKER